MITKRVTTLLAISPIMVGYGFAKHAEKQPNVIVVLTDDQGIGGLSCHNNPYLETPCLDRFYEEAVRMTDFHVSPLSTPSRGAIITGRYPIRNGAWATYKGRDILSRTSPTIAEVFRDGGYQTAMFGKWHLGDNYPYRPTDCGFEHSTAHRSGGVGELSDYWGNNYFDDTYFVNEVPTEFKGYCTDVWFAEAEKYITKHKDDEKPFFIYLATNAPHGPHYVAEKYSAPYKELEKQGVVNDAGFYGQIANLDENFGRFDEFLKANGLDENTILIFLTDNGAGIKDNTWSDGYSGYKTQKLEGGHRVPFFIRWADGGIEGGRDISALTAHVDMLPTLASLCGVELPKENKFDGVDFSPLLTNKEYEHNDRSIFIHHRQDSKAPMDVKGAAVAKGTWRLLDGDKLYDLSTDRAQKKNLAKQHPEIVEQLLAENAEFIAKTKEMPEYQDYIPQYVGAKEQKVAVLTIQHAFGKSGGIWEAEHVCAGKKVDNNSYALYFAQNGRYKISVSRWPRECQGTIWGIPERNPKNFYEYKAITPEKAQIKLNDKVYTESITKDMKEADFIVKAKKGRAMFKAEFVENDKPFGAYYIYIEKL